MRSPTLSILTGLIVGLPFEVHTATLTVTNLNDSGVGSLRQTIADASDGDTVNFGVAGTIFLLGGELVLDKDLTIEGPGANNLTISGNNSSRVFLVENSSRVGGVTVAISDVTIRDGNVVQDSGAGIASRQSAVELANVTVTANDSGTFFGGGIANQGGDGVMTITNSLITNNSVGGVYNRGSLYIDASTISGNDGNRGGGVINQFGSVQITNSTISNNTAALGGGIDNIGSLIVSNSTISGNDASGAVTLAPWGGGISNFGLLVLTSSTLTNNSAEGRGGGLFNRGNATVENTIIAENASGNDCDDLVGLIVSSGHNLDSDATCNFMLPSDLPNTVPGLDALSDNGGLTDTHALLDGSPAVDAGGENCHDPDGNPLLIDQRREPRPEDGNDDGIVACDIGSYERQPLPVVTVDIDIMPGSDRNAVNARSKGVIPVAILGSIEFDATQVDVLAATLGSSEASPTHDGHVEDVNDDGFYDFVLHFRTSDTGIVCGDSAATLAGMTFVGVRFGGTDSVETVGCR